MDCTGTKKLLNEYLDKALTDEPMALVREHLGSCASCERDFRELLRARSALKSAPRFDAPAGFSSRVMKKIRLEEDACAEEPGLFRWLWSMPMHLKLAEAAAIVILIATGVYSTGFLSGKLLDGDTISEQGEGLLELALLEELDTVPPGSMGDMFLSIKENGNER